MTRAEGIYAATTPRDLEVALLRTDDMSIDYEGIAIVCHEANRAYCATLGDYSQKPWATAPEHAKDSAISGVKFHIENPDAGPDHSHNDWMRHKVEAGWTWGLVKNEDLKQHHCIVPYDQLPVEQQNKDYLFRAIVHALKPRNA
jgi:hypothetical protein